MILTQEIERILVQVLEASGASVAADLAHDVGEDPYMAGLPCAARERQSAPISFMAQALTGLSAPGHHGVVRSRGRRTGDQVHGLDREVNPVRATSKPTPQTTEPGSELLGRSQKELAPGAKIGWVRISKIVSEFQEVTGLRIGPMHTDPACQYIQDREDPNGRRFAIIQVSGKILQDLPICKVCSGIARPKRKVKFHFDERSLQPLSKLPGPVEIIKAGDHEFAIPKKF